MGISHDQVGIQCILFQIAPSCDFVKRAQRLTKALRSNDQFKAPLPTPFFFLFSAAADSTQWVPQGGEGVIKQKKINLTPATQGGRGRKKSFPKSGF
jgi:hypothetical protein